jgi:hypothetical protein
VDWDGERHTGSLWVVAKVWKMRREMVRDRWGFMLNG